MRQILQHRFLPKLHNLSQKLCNVFISNNCLCLRTTYFMTFLPDSHFKLVIKNKHCSVVLQNLSFSSFVFPFSQQNPGIFSSSILRLCVCVLSAIVDIPECTTLISHSNINKDLLHRIVNSWGNISLHNFFLRAPLDSRDVLSWASSLKGLSWELTCKF